MTSALGYAPKPEMALAILIAPLSDSEVTILLFLFFDIFVPYYGLYQIGGYTATLKNKNCGSNQSH
ncbi:hypothetical protein [Geobacillus sp. LEMMY01]|uniref:hypothetical protein n=1 Tax=Geobacillus sp. LEMMY01 TaxID=1954237 RepID=UPI0015910610|nr:hypothetical protein [Geobacillus sp. LEMMY01]